MTLITKRTETANHTLSTRTLPEAFACRCRGKTSCLVRMTNRGEDTRLHGCRRHSFCSRGFSYRRAHLRH